MNIRFALLLPVLVFVLDACGFEPMYGSHRFSDDGPATEKNTIEAQLETIEIENIADRSGQFLRNLLIDRFYRSGRPQNPQYHLKVVNLTQNITDLDITKESDATRAQLKIITTITLIDASGNAVLTKDLKAIGSYNILTSEFSTRISEENTRENVLNDLAQQIELQIALYLQGKKDKSLK